MAVWENQGPEILDRLGERSTFTCPECAGTLWRMNDARMLRYRCHTGHAFTSEALSESQEQVTEKPPGVNHVDVIAAYNSTAAAQHDLELTAAERNLAAQAVLLTRRLAIPDIPNLEDRLRLAIDLSRDDDFRKRRADLFEWQQRMAAKDVPPEAVVAELCALTDAYNDAVRRAHKNVYWRYAFTVAGIAISLAALPIGAAAIAAGASAGLSILRFAMFDKKPAVEPGDARPAAMFHDIEAKIDLELKPPEHP